MLPVILGIVAVPAGIVAYAATRPNQRTFERSTVIKAEPGRIFPLINELRAWPEWSPWEEKDPAMKRTYGETTLGTGAVYAWEGNKDVGQGRMEITASVPNERIEIGLNFIKPFKAENSACFTLAPVSGGTQVTWSMTCTANLPIKVFTLFMSMDKMMGKDFETGLAKLKAIAEKV